MTTLYYTRHQRDFETNYDTLAKAVTEMEAQFWESFSCSQMVADTKTKTLYFIADINLVDVAAERTDFYENFKTFEQTFKNFEQRWID